MQMIRRLAASEFVTKLADYLTRQYPDAPDHLGYVSYAADDTPVDGGGYGNLDEDPRPDFVKQDEIGWQRINR